MRVLCEGFETARTLCVADFSVYAGVRYTVLLQQIAEDIQSACPAGESDTGVESDESVYKHWLNAPFGVLCVFCKLLRNSYQFC